MQIAPQRNDETTTLAAQPVRTAAIRSFHQGRVGLNGTAFPNIDFTAKCAMDLCLTEPTSANAGVLQAQSEKSQRDFLPK